MQLVDVVEIQCVPQQDDVVNCGVHVIPPPPTAGQS
jgi:hypothetical protein